MPLSETTMERNTLEPIDFPCAVTLGNSFNAALLLTGTATAAERAVLQAISSLSPAALTSGTLLHRTIALSIEHSRHDETKRGELGIAPLNLPLELKAVLHLKSKLRQCFVLRMLLGLSVRDCVSLLQLSEDEVADNVCAAMLWLANARSNLHANGSCESFQKPLSSESWNSIEGFNATSFGAE